MRRFLILGSLIVAVVAIVAGCEKPAETLTTISSGDVELTDADPSTLDSALNEQQGKVVLVDFWATWCGPCRTRFPHFVETHKKYAEKGLVCLSVSGDNAGPGGKADKRQVLGFLKEKGATFKNFLLVSYTPKYAEAIGKRFGFMGNLPFVALFGKDGRKVWDSEEKKLDDAELDKLIESELAK